MSTLYVDSIQPKTTGQAINVATTNQTGHVLQMPFKQYTDTTQVTIPANTDTTIDVLSVNITPTSTSSLIKLDSFIFHEWVNPDAPYYSMWYFYRDTTKLGAPKVGNRISGITNSATSYYSSDSSSTAESANYSYFDSPNTTSQITYKVGVICFYSTSVFINRTVTDSNNLYSTRGMSFISATEIGG